MILSQKQIFVVGVRNRRSLAYAIARAIAAQGGLPAFAVQPGEKSFDKTAALLAEDFPGAPIFPCDVGCDEDITAAVEHAAAGWGGRIDGLVHAVAFARRETIDGKYHEGIARDSFAEALDISAYSLTALAKAALPFMRDHGGGIVTLSYLGGERALPGYNVMGVAKAALEASVRYLAFGMGEYGIRVNAVSAGPVKTLAAAGIGNFGKILKYVARQAPLQRNISADEVGDAAAFLLSDLARGVSGEVLFVDAGFHVTAGFPADDDLSSSST